MPDATGHPGLLPDNFVPTPRSRMRRHPERAHYDRATVYAILDAALLCHVGYVLDGKPYVTPTPVLARWRPVILAWVVG